LRWNSEILYHCHAGEKFRLAGEVIFPLNKSNTKYVTVGFTPHDDFKLRFMLWDLKSDKRISLDLSDIFKIQIFLSENSCSNTFLELTTAQIYHNARNTSVYHIREKTTMKTISFTDETLQNLVQSKHLYQYPTQNLDLMGKADNIAELFSEYNGKCLTNNDLRSLFQSVCEKMSNQDKIFLGEMIFKFPSTLLAVINKEKLSIHPSLY
jgi:hypothetical protein